MVKNDYDVLLDLVTRRASHRKLKPDPIPDAYVDRILDVARWAMSGANSQPWEYIVVKSPETKRALFRAYSEEVRDYTYWMEQQRVFELRHPAYAMSETDPRMKAATLDVGFSEAPVFICVLGDGRRQSGTVQGAHTFGREQTHLTDGLANTSTLIHLAAASLGLGAQWVTIPIQEPFKRILGVPDLLTFYLIIPIGYPAVPPRQGNRRSLDEIVHHEHYEPHKYMSNKEAIEYLYQLRGKTMGMYRHSYIGDAPGDKDKGGDGTASQPGNG
jgi:nitroreductase